MNRNLFRALIGAPSFCLTAVCVAAAPQYALVDLGSTEVAGSGLVWQPKQSYSAPNLPSAGGNQCLGGTPSNYVWAQYGNVLVGETCVAGIGGEAAKWTYASGQYTLTTLGWLPGSGGDVYGPSSTALDFNNVGDIVGDSQSRYGTYHPGAPYVAVHGFLYNNGNWTELIPIAGPNYNSEAEAVNDSHEIVGATDTISSVTGAVLHRAFVYTGGTMYNLTFYLVGGPTVLLSDAYWIDCQGNIAAVGTPAAGGTTHTYLLVRQGPARTNCPK